MSGDAPWDWFTRARIPFPFAVNILRELQGQGYIRYDGDTTRLTDRGSALADELEVRAAPSMACPRCAGSGTDWGALQDAYSRFMKIYEARPHTEDPELDQARPGRDDLGIVVQANRAHARPGRHPGKAGREPG
jgi:predicted methyltransferase